MKIWYRTHCEQMEIQRPFDILDKYLYLFLPCSNSKPKLCFSYLWAIAFCCDTSRVNAFHSYW